MFTWPGVMVIYEVVLRTVIVFFFTFLMMRLRGNKQLMQMNVFDIIIIIALGSAVGDAMIYGDTVIPLVSSLTAIATLVILILAIENVLAIAPSKIVKLIEGVEVVLIKDGVVDNGALKRVNIHEDELKSRLRSRNIHHFSQVKIAYLEPDGSISIVRKRNNSENHSVVNNKNKKKRK